MASKQPTLPPPKIGIHCPHCGIAVRGEVVDSRPGIGSTIKRRRKCGGCEKTFRTRELVELDKSSRRIDDAGDPAIWIRQSELTELLKDLRRLTFFVAKLKNRN